jgi:hypothetical protein
MDEKGLTTIARAFEGPATLDFEGLVTRGIDLAQKLAGDTWTDYNEHDPGVTILQQLCFALTDIAYRTQHAPADLILGGAAGATARNQALFSGHEALTCAPLTEDDYRSLLYDKIVGLQNAWLPRDSTSASVHRVLVQRFPASGSESEELEGKEVICAAAERVLHAQRNLGEDFASVEQVPELLLALVGKLEIGTEDTPEDIVAHVLHAVQTQLVPPPRVTQLDAKLERSVPMDRVFDGPRLDHGEVALTPYAWLTELPAPEQILSAIRSVTGVRAVRDLELEEVSEVAVDGMNVLKHHVPQRRYRLSADGTRWVPVDGATEVVPRGQWIPHIANWVPGLEVVRNGMEVNLGDGMRIGTALTHIRERLRQQETYLATRLRDQKYARVPQGNDRHVAHYRSIQHFFPSNYGVGPDGVPPTSSWRSERERRQIGSVSRQSQALQLKSYLLFFEQLLADHLSQLANVPTLFAIDRVGESVSTTAAASTYFGQSLRHAPALVDDPPDIGLVLASDSAPRDDASARRRDLMRREQVLDHLLARFGEAFDDVAAPGTGGTSSASREAAVSARLTRKRAFLRDIIALGSGRGIGIDYRFGKLRDVHPDDGLAADEGGARQFGWMLHTPLNSVAWSASGGTIRLPERSPIEQRISALAGIDGALYVLEHLLLRPRGGQHKSVSRTDPYRLTVVYSTPRASEDLQQLVRRIARENSPAHLMVYCLPLTSAGCMGRFEALYAEWASAWQPLGDEASRKNALPPDREQLERIDAAASALHEFLLSSVGTERDRRRSTQPRY